MADLLWLKSYDLLREELKPNYKWNNRSALNKFPIDFEKCVETNIENVNALSANSGLVNVIGKSESDTYVNLYVQDHKGNIGHIASHSHEYFEKVEPGCVLALENVEVKLENYDLGVKYKIKDGWSLTPYKLISNVEQISFKPLWDTFDSLKYNAGHCILKFVEKPKYCRPRRDLQVIEVYARTADNYLIRIGFWNDKEHAFDMYKHVLEQGKWFVLNNCYIRKRQDPEYDMTLNAKENTIIESIDPEEEEDVVSLEKLKKSPPLNGAIKITLMKLKESQTEETVTTSICSDGSTDPEGRFNACILRTSTDTIMNIPVGCYFELKVNVTQENGKLHLTGVTDPVELFTQESTIQERAYNCL